MRGLPLLSHLVCGVPDLKAVLWFENLGVLSLLIANDVVLMTYSGHDIQHALSIKHPVVIKPSKMIMFFSRQSFFTCLFVWLWYPTTTNLCSILVYSKSEPWCELRNHTVLFPQICISSHWLWNYLDINGLCGTIHHKMMQDTNVWVTEKDEETELNIRISKVNKWLHIKYSGLL